jgi:glycosyltransferase involved in cell wall biosynthesis
LSFVGSSRFHEHILHTQWLCDRLAMPIFLKQRNSTPDLRVDQVLVSTRVGGAASVAMRLAQFVQASGGESRAWVPGPGPAADTLASLSIPWRSYELDAMTVNALKHSTACLRMAAGLMRGRRVVHVHTPSAFRLIRPALRLAGVGTIVHIHLEPSMEEIQWAFQDPPDLVVTCARYLVESLQKVKPRHGRALNVLPVANAVDLEKYCSGDRKTAKAAVGAATDRPLILMMANLAPHKGQTTALHATFQLRRRGILANCWFAGEERDPGGGFRAQLEELAHSLDIYEQIRFLGFRNDGRELLQAADILLLPSTREGLPISILEAQASGTVVIGAPHPGILEIVKDKETGFIIAPDDYQGYADCILKLVSEQRLYEHVSTQAYNHVIQQYNWRRYSEQMLRAYNLVMNRAVQSGLAL